MTIPANAEVLTRTTPLGISFFDAATGLAVRSGLESTAHRPAEPRRRFPSTLSASGAHWFGGIPPLAEFERGSGDDRFWALPHPDVELRIEVKDRERRFLPFSFLANAPHRGLFSFDDAMSSPPGPLGVPLFSAPARSLPGFAGLRASMRNAADDTKPARHVLLEIRLNNRQLARGVSDDNGQLSVLFPYPAPVPVFGGASMSGMEGALRSQRWTLDVRAFYQPRPVTEYPDLEQVLEQPPARLLQQVSLSEVNSVELRFGEEAVLKSELGSEILVSPV